MARPRTFDKPKRVTAVVDSELYEKIVKAARDQSKLEGRKVKISEIARRGLQIVFPVK